MITYKIKLEEEIDITNYQKQYTNVSHVALNRLQEGLSLSETEQYVKTKMNNIDLMNADFIKVATNQVKNLINKGKTVIFGGKKNWVQYNQGQITKEEYKKKKLLPIMARGTVHDTKGNRKFQLDIANNQVIFKPNKHTKIIAKLPKTKLNGNLMKLQTLCELNQAYFTCSLSNNYIWISFDESILKTEKYRYKKQRILSIDLNPNSIGVVVSDQNKILHKEIIGLLKLNEENTNKKLNEDYEISKRLVELAKYYQCEYFVYEKLKIDSSDKGKGKWFNKVCNQWRRNKITNNINKRCNIIGIKVQEIVAHYSSFIGQIDNPDDYDSIAAAIELARRGLLFVKKYHYNESVKFDLKLNKKIAKHLVDRWKKKLNVELSMTYKELYTEVKKTMENGYRFLFPHESFSLRLKSRKSKVFVHFC